MISDQMAGRSRVAWSADGKKIAMVTKVGTGRQIDVITLAGPSAPLQLTNDSSAKDDPAWCGTRVGFWSDRTGTQQIYTVDATTPGGSTIQVTKETHDVNDPSFSPDCTQMAYTDQPNKTERHLWITPANGQGKARQLTSNVTRDMDATWSPKNGTWIAFARGSTEQPSIWAIRADGKDERRISPAGQYMAHPDWS
jgi:Tol biopolymer transport system component